MWWKRAKNGRKLVKLGENPNIPYPEYERSIKIPCKWTAVHHSPGFQSEGVYIMRPYGCIFLWWFDSLSLSLMVGAFDVGQPEVTPIKGAVRVL